MASTTKLSPRSSFFTDPALISQTAAQAFGATSADIFQLTSKFTVATDADAFAICTGTVLIQPQEGNSNLVNLILRPFIQPINGLSIKYFVYRGLNKSNFFAGDNVIAADGNNTSDFINKVNAAFTAYYTHIGEERPGFLSKYLGFDAANQPAGTQIADLFFKQTSYTGNTEDTHTAFELPLINAGMSLGKFAAATCGIDVVIDYGDFNLPAANDRFVFDLNYARSAGATIDLTSITDNLTKKLLKEQIYQFLDVAAFFGLHATNGTVSVISGGTQTDKKGNDIYTSVIQNFNSKETLYLYIQSDRTRSYNFYNNYQLDDDGNCLQLGFAADTLTKIKYDTKGWPIIIISDPQTANNGSITTYLQFFTDNNPNTVLYGQIADLVNAQGNNFSSPEDVQQSADDLGQQTNLTKIFQIANPATGATGTANFIATFNILIYQGALYNYISGQTTDDEGNTVNVTATPQYFDDVFGELNASPVIKSVDNPASFSISAQRLKLMNHVFNNVQKGVSAVQTKIVNDTLTTGNSSTPTLNRVIYVSQAADVYNDAVAVNGTISSDTQSSPSVSGAVSSSQAFQFPSSTYYHIIPFTDNDTLINGLSVSATDSNIPSLIIVGLTKAENDALLALISDNSLTNPRMFLIPLFSNDNQLVSTEGIVYQKFNVGIVGEDTTGTLQLELTDDGIDIYSIDNRLYYSAAFTAYMQPDKSISSLILDLDISL